MPLTHSPRSRLPLLSLAAAWLVAVGGC
ncbi:MAG: hypothetical protein RI907_84, partial [Pseudomonadota bacterium]